jgi:hypothetical protein
LQIKELKKLTANSIFVKKNIPSQIVAKARTEAEMQEPKKKKCIGNPRHKPIVSQPRMNAEAWYKIHKLIV